MKHRYTTNVIVFINLKQSTEILGQMAEQYRDDSDHLTYIDFNITVSTVADISDRL